MTAKDYSPEDFIDPAQEVAYREFSDNLVFEGKYGNFLNYLLIYLKKTICNLKLTDISWSFFMDTLIDVSSRAKIVNQYFCFLIKSGKLNSEHKEYIENNAKMICHVISVGSLKRMIIKYRSRITPYSIIAGEGITKSGEKYVRLACIPDAGPELHNLLDGCIKYCKSYGRESLSACLFNVFEAIFDKDTINLNSPEKYNDRTFELQYKMVNDSLPENTSTYKRAKYLGSLLDFYIYIQKAQQEDIRRNNFKLYSDAVLKYPNFQIYYNAGYRVVNYNIYEDFPKFPRLMINPGEMFTRGAETTGKVTAVNFSSITNIHLRNWTMECFWKDTDHVLCMRGKTYAPIVNFLAHVSKRLEEYEKDITFDLNDVVTFMRNEKRKNISNSSMIKRCGLVRYFLTFADKRGYTCVDPIVFRFLSHPDSRNNAYKEAYTNEELQKLSEAYKKSFYDAKGMWCEGQYQLYQYIYEIIRASSIRISNLLDATVHSLCKVLTKSGGSEYKLVIHAKNSGDSSVEYQISHHVKELIVEVTAITEQLREESIGPEKEFLFLYRMYRHHAIGRIRSDSCQEYHKKMCKLAGVRLLPQKAVRNTYEQKATERLIKEGYDPQSKMAKSITGHSPSVHFKYYDKPDIKEFCQRFYEVEIGSVHIYGSIERTNELDESHTVMNGCGRCKLNKCIQKGPLDCLVCKSFVATVDCIPFYEKAIAEIDKCKLNETIDHEKEFLQSKKKLYVAYLERLYELD